MALARGFAGALGGTRTPNLLIRRDLHDIVGPAQIALTCRNLPHWSARLRGVTRRRKAKIRPPWQGLQTSVPADRVSSGS
jgi:hypothetical protein